MVRHRSDHPCGGSPAGTSVFVKQDDERRQMVPRPVTRIPIVTNQITAATGYGKIGEWLGRCFEENGWPTVFVGPIDETFLPITEFQRERVVRSAPDAGWCIMLDTPAAKPPPIPTIHFTMWESTHIGQAAVDNLNLSEAVIVPCQWNKENFIKAGVTRPIYVVPLGISPEEGYVWHDFPEGKPYTFGMAARMAHGGSRKGLNEGMAAFVHAFPYGDDRVRLEVKVFEDCVPALRVPDDPRIKVITKAMNTAEMIDWYAGIHCLFVPSKGEGWGMHTLGAMAIGRPVIATPYSGTREFFDDSCGFRLDYTIEPSDEFYTGLGEWAVPTDLSMKSALRHMFLNRGLEKVLGHNAAKRAAEFTWHRTARELAAVIREIGFPLPEPIKAPDPVPNPPSYIQMARNLGSSVATFVASGFEMADAQTKERRLSICQACPKFKDGSCLICGCTMAVKVAMQAMECPDDPPRW